MRKQSAKVAIHLIKSGQQAFPALFVEAGNPTPQRFDCLFQICFLFGEHIKFLAHLLRILFRPQVDRAQRLSLPAQTRYLGLHLFRGRHFQRVDLQLFQQVLRLCLQLLTDALRRETHRLQSSFRARLSASPFFAAFRGHAPSITLGLRRLAHVHLGPRQSISGQFPARFRFL